MSKRAQVILFVGITLLGALIANTVMVAAGVLGALIEAAQQYE